MTENKQLYETMPVSRAVLVLALPTVLSQLITLVYNLADTFFIGQLGDPDQVAAVTLSLPIYIFLTGIANLFGIGGAAMISRCLGAGKEQVARHCSAFCIWTAAVFAFCYGLLLYVCRGFLLPLLGADAETFGFASSYIFWTTTVGAVPTVLCSVLAHLLRSEGYSKQASWGVGLGGILNIVFDPLFIYGCGLEVRGAAVATMLSNALAVAYLLFFLYKIRRRTVLTVAPAAYSCRHHIPAEVLTGGLPSFVMLLMSTVSNAVLNALVASYSNMAVAGMGIAKKIDSLAYLLAQGMSQGVISLVAYNYASGNRQRMKQAIKTACAYSLGIACTGMVLLLIAAQPITALFIDDAATVAYGQRFLRILCLACPTTAANFMIITVFQATKNKHQALLLSFLRKGSLDIPLMLLMNRWLGVTGILWATPVADSFALAVALAMFVPFLKQQRA